MNFSETSLKDFISKHEESYLLESKADDALSIIIIDTKEDIAEATPEEKEEIFAEAGKKIKTIIDRLIKNVARDSVYIDDEKVLNNVKKILKNAEIVDENINDFLEACAGNEKVREKYEFDVMKDIAGVEERGRRKKKEDSKEEKETSVDPDTEAKSKKAMTSEETDKLEKETEEEISALIGKKGDLEKKTLLAIIKKENDGEILEAILGETSLKDKDIEGLEYEEDVMAGIVGGKKFTSPAQIAKRIKELKGTKIYFYSAKKKDDGDNPWTIIKVK